MKKPFEYLVEAEVAVVVGGCNYCAAVDVVLQPDELLAWAEVFAFHDCAHKSSVPLPKHPRPWPSFRRNRNPSLNVSYETKWQGTHVCSSAKCLVIEFVERFIESITQSIIRLFVVVAI